MHNLATLNTSSSEKAKRNTYVVSFTSGKGGVGKTISAINMAMAARNSGKRVLIFDGDLGLANVDIVLGLHGRYNINDVLDGLVGIDEIVVSGPLGIDIIPSGSGLANLADLSYVKRIQMIDAIKQLHRAYDLVIIDTGAGISESVMHLNGFSDQVIVVTTSEPHAMTDAYAVIKVLYQKHGDIPIKLLVNSVKSKDEGLKVWRRISDVANRFLSKKLDYLGAVSFDPRLQESVRRQCVASERSLHTIAMQEWNQIFGQMEKQFVGQRNVTDYFQSLLSVECSVTT